MRAASAVGSMFESLENRVLLSASVHHAGAKSHPVHAATKPAVHAAPAKKPVVKTTPAAPTTTTPKKGDPIFMKFGPISGDVTEKGFTGDIELNSFQWGVSRTIGNPTPGSTDRPSSSPSVLEITITKMMDKTSPLLLQALLQGQSTSEVDIFFVHLGAALGKPGQNVTYAEYVLSNVLVSSDTVSSGGERPTESLTLNFTKVQFKYSGNGAPVTTVYDLTQTQAA
jgi:type VI secretion system secreted protein Hcp